MIDLGARLKGLSRDELVRLLLAHAERLPVDERNAFLEMFPAAGSAVSVSAPTPDDLLHRTRDFARRVASGEYEEGDDEEVWRGRYGWADEEPSPAWVADADALFAEAGELFLASTPEQAREVYSLLLDLFRPDVSGESREGWPGGALEIWSLEDADVPEALARYLRCVYETAAAEGRVIAVRDAWSLLPWSPAPITLVQVIEARADPLPDLATFLPRWIDELVDGSAWPGSRDRVRLLAEAAWLHRGLDTLADLALRPGPHRGGISLIRLDALAASGRSGDAVQVAREALSLPDLEPDLRAEIADRLADLCTDTADLPGAVRAREDAWQVHPTRYRLLALVDDARAAHLEDDVLTREAARILEVAAGQGLPVDRFGCELLLLAGRLDPAVEALTAASPLGWSRPAHPGPVVLPYLWAAATTVPTAGLLQVAFSAIDELSDELGYELLLRSSSAHGGGDGPWAAGPQIGAAPARPGLTTLLADVLSADPVTGERAAALVETARRVTDARIEAIVSNKHRGAYARAAVLAFAHAEAVAMRSSSRAQAYLSGVRARYPRHIAFRRELDVAAKSSVLNLQTSHR